MVPEQSILKFKSGSKSVSDNSQMVSDLIRVRNGLEQVLDGLKWLGANGKNGRTHATYEV
jgi:hypothetical protein